MQCVCNMLVEFCHVEENDLGKFRHEVKEAFSVAVVREFGVPKHGEVIPDEDIDGSLYNPCAEVCRILADGNRVGGVVFRIDNESHRNSVDLLYIYPECHGRGIGLQVWRAIEERYPDTEIWELITPYFEKRNIHFYLNKCGFHIVEFFCKFHKDSYMRPGAPEWQNEYFRFEKRMK